MPGAVAQPARAQSARAVPSRPSQHDLSPRGARLSRRPSCPICGLTTRGSHRRRRARFSLAALVALVLAWPVGHALELAGADVAGQLRDRAEVAR